MAAVRSGQCARRGGRSDRRGYGGVARMCYVQIPLESGRCQERKVGGSEARPADSY